MLSHKSSLAVVLGTIITSEYKTGCNGSGTFFPWPLASPATYRMSYADIWRADQGTDLDESNFAPWLVCPVEQLRDVSKRLHIRNSTGEKALGQYCCQKLLTNQGCLLCSSLRVQTHQGENKMGLLMCWTLGMWARNFSSEKKGSKTCPGFEQFRSLNTCWYHPVSVTLICFPAWAFLELQFQSKAFQYTFCKWQHVHGSKFGLTDCSKTCQRRLPF